MRIGVIGAGSMGRILAHHLVRLGHQVSVANSRGPESLTALAVEIGATPASVVDAATAGEVVVIAIPTKAVADLPRALFSNVPSSVVVIDISNYHPELRDGRIDAIDRGMLDSQWVARQIGRPVIKAFNNILAKSLLERGVRGERRGGSLSRSPAIPWTPRPQCFVLSMILASTRSTVVIWTTPGGSSPERRLTARILKPLLSGARSPKLTGAGSPNTGPNRRPVSGAISRRRHEEAQRVNEVSLRAVGVDLSGGQLRVRGQLSRAAAEPCREHEHGPHSNAPWQPRRKSVSRQSSSAPSQG
jgi:predicted dinucleotide-binding enzyme